MAGDIQVDYMGNGVMQTAFHPFAPVTTMYDKIQLPFINLNEENQYNWNFSIPANITNPFFHVVGLYGVDYGFTPININTGEWQLNLIGRVTLYREKGSPTNRKALGYTNPININNNVSAYIYYGGFRG